MNTSLAFISILAINYGKLIEALPTAGTNPFTFISYALLLGVSVLYVYRRSQSSDLLKTLALLPETERKAFLESRGYIYEKFMALPEKERKSYLMALNWMTLGVIVTIAVLMFVTIWITQAKKLESAKASIYLNQGISYEEEKSDYKNALIAYRASNLLNPQKLTETRIARCLVALESPSDAKNYIEGILRSPFSQPSELSYKADLIRLLALIERRQKKETEALSHLDDAETLIAGAEDTNSIRVRAMIYNQKGNIAASGNNFKSAVSFFEKAIHEDKKIYDSKAIVKDTSNLASAYSRMGDLDSAFKLLSSGIAEFRGTNEGNWLGALLWKRAKINDERWPIQARNDYVEAILTLSIQTPPDGNTLAKARGDYAQFLLLKDNDNLGAFAQAVLSLNDSFNTADAHAILAQTDGLFQILGAMKDEAGEAATGVAALRLALYYANGDELEQLKSRIEERGILKSPSFSTFHRENTLESICIILFQRSGISAEKWKKYISPFTANNVALR